jgi:hypothetical protein
MLNESQTVPGSQFIHDIINKIKELIDQGTGVNFFLFPKIDKAAIKSIPACTPFVLVD